MELVTKKPRKPYTKRAPKPVQPDQSALIGELVSLVREVSAQQNKVLSGAMEAQVAQAEMLKTWMSMFVPQSGASKSTNELDRDAIRNNAELAEWEEVLNPFSLDTLMSDTLQKS